MMDSYRPALWRSALLCLSLLVLSCGGEAKPPIKDPPQAILTVPQPNTVGQSLTVRVGATGCDQFQSLTIYDGEDFLRSVPYGGGGAVTVELNYTEIKYTRSLAAQMTLKARVVCSDGRQNDSQPQPATFFPAAEVIEPPAGSNLQVVPDNFIAEGSGLQLHFIGCGTLSTGVGRLFKVNKAGTVLATLDMPFPCTNQTVISNLDPLTRKRWVWTPDGGAVAVDEQLRKSGQTLIKVDLLTVGPGGDAIIYNAGGTGSGMHRLSHETGVGLKWSYTTRGFMITPPVVNTNGLVMAATITSDEVLGAVIVVSSVDYGTQNPSAGGVETNAFFITRVPVADPDNVTAPVAFNTDGSLLYVAIPRLNEQSELVACATRASGCEGTAQRWASAPLPGHVVALIPYANGSRIAAIAPQKTWFLEASTGAVVNKGQQPLLTEGGLVTLQVQPGSGPYPHAFYLLNGPPAQEGLPAPVPVEIVGTDSADRGLLFRYQITNGSMSAAVDSEGTLWLRVGPKLVRPLTPPEYRQVRPVTP